jgi:hypothetical protein
MFGEAASSEDDAKSDPGIGEQNMHFQNVCSISYPQGKIQFCWADRGKANTNLMFVL